MVRAAKNLPGNIDALKALVVANEETILAKEQLLLEKDKRIAVKSQYTPLALPLV